MKARGKEDRISNGHIFWKCNVFTLGITHLIKFFFNIYLCDVNTVYNLKYRNIIL